MLEALREARKKQLLGYLVSIEEELVAAAANPFTLDALRAYDAGWVALGLGQKEMLQRLYITENPNPTGSKETLDHATDGSAYSKAHGQYDPRFPSFLNARGYYDIFRRAFHFGVRGRAAIHFCFVQVRAVQLCPIEGAGRQIAHDDISAIGACGLYQHALAQVRAHQVGTL